MAIDHARDGAPQALSLPSDPAAPRIAREFVAAKIGEFPADLVDDALILVSELVTNAVVHGRPEISVQVDVRTNMVNVAVHDGGDEIARRRLRPPTRRATSGRGLIIIDAVASRWGVRADERQPGKTVWFELQSA